MAKGLLLLGCPEGSAFEFSDLFSDLWESLGMREGAAEIRGSAGELLGGLWILGQRASRQSRWSSFGLRSPHVGSALASKIIVWILVLKIISGSHRFRN